MTPLNAPPISAAAEKTCFHLLGTEEGRDDKKKGASEGDCDFCFNFEF